jgi:aminodeoxyfutalosine deaminase
MPTSAPARIVHADVVLPGEAAPVFDAAVVVAQDGLVLDVGPAGQVLPRHAGAPVERFAGAIGPGLVNAHTHIELSSLRGKIAGGAGFVPWLESMMAARGATEPHEAAIAMERAVDELERSCTAAVGDIGNTPAAWPVLVRRSVGGIAFREVLGLDPIRSLAGVAAIRDELEARAEPMLDLPIAPAPHAVYSTHPDAVRAAVDLARALGRRSCVHLAEHTAERAFLELGGGPFADFVHRMRLCAARFPAFGKGPIDVAAELGLLAPDVVIVHLTDARPPELARVAESGAPVVLCPRSNLHIEARLPPVGELLQAGIVPALGTDSLASNESLDVLAEASTLHAELPDLSPRALFEMATAAGGRALGRRDLGRIARGTRPGLVAYVSSGSRAMKPDPFLSALHSTPSERRWLFRRHGEVQT